MSEKQTITKADVATLPANFMKPEGALIPVIANKYDDKMFEEVASGGKFLPRLQLYGGNSDLAKEGKIQMGTYGLVTNKDSVTALGNEVDVLVVGWRPKAIDMSGEDVVACYNPTSLLFKTIEAKAGEKDSNCMFGPEFLVYVPSTKTWATFLMGSKTARREAPQMKVLMGGAATLKVTLIKTQKYSWHASVVTKCSTPFELPPSAEIIEKATAFNNPPEVEKELVEETPAANKRAR